MPEHRNELLAVYRDGDRLWEEEFPVIEEDNGEVVLTLEATRRWEERHRHYLDLADRGELPEYTTLEEGGDPANVSVLKSLVVYREGDRVWRDEFDIIVTPDGEERVPPHVARQLEQRQRDYLALSRRGLLPEPDEAPAPDAHEAAGA